MSTHEDMHDIAVIGAGAAGLAASIFTAEAAAKGDRPQNIVLLDGVKTIGAKILISGGGRCNVAHEVVTPTDYFGNRRIIRNVLAAFSVEQTVKWFASLGVELKREKTGKLFPVTDKARTILTALLNRCRALGVIIQSDHRVTRVDHLPGPQAAFSVHHTHGTLHARKVILATGGRSIPKSGSDGFGYSLARRLGHHVTATVPALVSLVLDDTMFHKTLSGLSHEVELTTMVKSCKVDCRIGSLLWTHFGISGPVVMDASRFWTLGHEQGETVEVYGNFLPGQMQEQAKSWLMGRATDNPRRSLLKIWAQQIPERFAEALCSHIECDPNAAVAQLPRKDRDRLLAALTKFKFPVKHDRGWNYAEVTAGGVPLEEIHFQTMESKLVPGLYLIGEILDCDGRIGGFNFQWAWATGYLAGRAVVPYNQSNHLQDC
ncbi:MAG TPA: NAD(P)/FAD-dependent oxidoreductase [Nitrospiraceae bacterium]|nr:NAD(P)/FAD-dependent oxidoreductase [Nitrospiraceae bacterium]